MKILSRYTIKAVLLAIGTVVLILIGIDSFVILVNELSDIGHGNYTLTSAIWFTFLTLPSQIYEFFPAGSLLGSLVGLGILASHNELTVMRASGISVKQIAFTLMKVAFVLIFLITLVGEFIVPYTTQLAQNAKTLALSEGQSIRTHSGIWTRSNNSFIHIDQILPKSQMQNITRYQFDDKFQLQEITFAKEGHYQAGKWYLSNVSVSEFEEGEVKARYLSQLLLPIALQPSLLTIGRVEAQEMPFLTLFSYIREQQRNHNDTTDYELAFWKRLCQPFTMCVMMLLAIPFVFGSLRKVTMGVRIVLGSIAGFGFYILNQFFGPVSLVYQFPVILAALLPTIVFFILAVILLQRTR